jgi:GNAT superfamily N-acetyltransferase
MAVIRRATPEDADVIGAVHMRAIREISASHYSQEDIAAWGTSRHPEFYLDSIRNKEFYVATEDDVVVGFGTFNQKSGEMEAVYVSPDRVRRGIGFKLLQVLEERASSHQVMDVYLKSSLNAIPFYERAGYTQRKAAKHRLQSGIEIPCVIMNKELPRPGGST